MRKINLVSVNMGYGHQRTAFPLRKLAVNQEVIQVNDYPDIPEKDKKIWKRAKRFYDFVSRFKKIPLLGDFSFSLFDRFQKIFHYYPKRDMSRPSFQLRQTFALIKKGWGRDFVEKCKIKNGHTPFVTSFFIPAFMAEHFNYPGDIFCLVCDADISRTWAPPKPKESRIKYFVPNVRTFERLKLYGVKKDNIYLTGYPLPEELVGQEDISILKKNLKKRLVNLDPKKKYFQKYKNLIKTELGQLPASSNRPLTIMFSVGGAGAQKEIGLEIAKVLSSKIVSNKVKLILSVGVRENIKNYFEEEAKKLNLDLSPNLEIIFSPEIKDYFKKFNQSLAETDILWTKPSELSFYSALGLPIIIAPPVGSQEDFNRRWLLKSGFGLSQENPEYTEQWLFDWLEHGYLAEAAMQGFVEGEKLATIKIEKICCG
jgi:hypothetical protein